MKPEDFQGDDLKELAKKVWGIIFNNFCQVYILVERVNGTELVQTIYLEEEMAVLHCKERNEEIRKKLARQGKHKDRMDVNFMLVMSINVMRHWDEYVDRCTEILKSIVYEEPKNAAHEENEDGNKE